MEIIEIPELFTPETLARFILDNILTGDRPVLWGQGDWVMFPGPALTDAGALREGLVKTGTECGTTGCIAGWAMILSVPADAVIDRFLGDAGVASEYGQTWRHASVIAQDALSLNWAQAEWLFASDRTLEEVRAALEAIAGGDRHWSPSDFSEWDDEDDEEV